MDVKLFPLERINNQIWSDLNSSIDQLVAESRFILGQPVSELEDSLARYVGATEAVCVGNGTDALELVFDILGLQRGDQVIIPAFGYISAAEMAARRGLDIIWCDVDEADYNIDVNSVASLITDRTRAIVCMSLFGIPVNFSELEALISGTNIQLIEDGAQSFGAARGSKKSCSVFPLSTTSFFPTKPLGGFGDGGAIFIKCSEMAEKARRLRNHGQSKKYRHDCVGRNSRLDGLQALVIAKKLNGLDRDIQHKNRLADLYYDNLSSIEDVKLPSSNGNYFSAWAQFTIQVPNRDLLRDHLRQNGVETGVYYDLPTYRQNSLIDYGCEPLASAERLCQRVLSLPIYAAHTESEIQYCCDVISNFFAG